MRLLKHLCLACALMLVTGDHAWAVENGPGSASVQPNSQTQAGQNSSQSDQSTKADSGQQTASSGADIVVEAGATYDALSNGYADWHSFYLSVAKTFARREVLYGTFRQTNQFSLNDQELMLGLTQPIGKWTAVVEGSFSPSHQVLSKWSAQGQIGRTFTNGWGFNVGGGHTEYATAKANLGKVTAEKHFKHYRAAYTLVANQLEGAGVAASHIFEGNYYYGEHSSLGMSASVGRDIESLVPFGVVKNDIRGLTLGGLHWFTPNWALSYDAALYRQGDFFTRKGARVGLRHRF